MNDEHFIPGINDSDEDSGSGPMSVFPYPLEGSIHDSILFEPIELP
jgi:hypothetical protein